MQVHYVAPSRDAAHQVALFPLSFPKRAGTVHANHPAVPLPSLPARIQNGAKAPCAFVEPRDGASATEAEVFGFCRARIAHFKASKTVVFGALPKAANGKIQKFIQRAPARDMRPSHDE